MTFAKGNLEGLYLLPWEDSHSYKGVIAKRLNDEPNSKLQIDGKIRIGEAKNQLQYIQRPLCLHPH